MLKRIIALLLVLTLALPMAGCTSALTYLKERLPDIMEIIDQNNTSPAKTPEVQPTEIPMVEDYEISSYSYSPAFAAEGFAASAPMASGAWEAYIEEEPEPLPFPDFNTEEDKYTKENSFRSVTTSPLSTFAADVDTTSYSNFRRQVLNEGKVNPDSVRIGEMINYFHYDSPEPTGTEPFSVTTEIAPCPWNANTQLLLIGLQAKKLNTEEMPQSNLVFLIDVSGSMDYDNKLPLVQRSFMTQIGRAHV